MNHFLRPFSIRVRKKFGVIGAKLSADKAPDPRMRLRLTYFIIPVINHQSFKVLLYPFTSLLAEFGGCLGLFLGFSFVTISDGVMSLAMWLKKNINKI